ncbi:hypothetical protein [Rhizobium ecuadorense]|uniref:hypothetical protein n=1 Tax=Rhizobium ecuadorense TaxID=1671795 RepID=UPI00067345E2|nr:hypothetical protein [Rhizobium ecuadorense]
MRIRVCDDDEELANSWVKDIGDALQDGDDVSRMDNAKDEISQLLNRKIAVENKEDPRAHATRFDEIDILVVDYDLLHLDGAGSRTTGEGVARLARTFSTCGAIVVMNQYRGAQFDLGMRGHLESFADVNVAADLIGSKSLWRAVAPQADLFNPTFWRPMPVLLEASRDLAKSLSDKGFDAPIAAQIGLELEASTELSDTAFGFLSGKAQTAEDLQKITLREFLTQSLDPKIVEPLLDTMPDVLFNFASFRIIKWLDRAVLRPMDVLIDVPHLIDRLPFLILQEKNDIDDPDAWSQAALDPEGRLNWELVSKYRNDAASKALGRLVIDWHRLSHDSQIDDMQDEYLEKNATRFHLAEDTSRFLKRENLTQYRADFHNFGDRRAIEKLATITYGPQRRMRFG